MKNKLMYGLATLILAFGLILGMSAFKNHASKRTTLTFYYSGPDYKSENVTNPSNWAYDPEENLCSGFDEMACTIQVDNSFVNSGTNTLKSSIALTATTSAPDIAYITGSADKQMRIYNQARH